MPRKYPGYNIERDGVTRGLLDRFQFCRQACWYWLNGWELVGAGIGTALWFGNAWHEVMRALRTGRDGHPRRFAGTAKNNLEDMLRTSRAGVLKLKKDALAGVSGEKEVEELEQAAIALDCLIPEYIARFWKDHFLSEWVGVESEFSVDFYGFKLRGKRDGLIKNSRGKMYRLMEYKTKARIDKLVLGDMLAFDGQAHWYALATEREKALPLSEVCKMLVRRPGEYPGKNESLADFAERLSARIRKEPDHYFIPFNVGLSGPQRKLFSRELMFRLKEFKAWLDGERPTYRSSALCSGWSANCPYIQVCAADRPEKALEKLCVQRDTVFPELND